MNLDELRALQDRCIAIADRLNLDNETPISCTQYGAPTIADLRRCVWPGFELSLHSFLEHFNAGGLQ
jgi:hypothetical protein